MILAIDPVLFQFGSLEIHYYGIFLALAFLGGYLWLLHPKGVGIFTLRVGNSTDFFFLIVSISGLIGAKLLSILISLLEGYPPSSIIYPLSSGFSFHGGLLGGLLGVLIYKHFHPQSSILHPLDRTVLYLPFAIFLVRIGNFINQELVGKPTYHPWGVIFSLIDSAPRHPVQLYEAAAALFIGFMLWFLVRGKTPLSSTPGVKTQIHTPGVFPGGVKEQSGDVALYFLLLYSLGRFITDFFRDDRTFAIFHLPFSLTPAQWVSLGLILISGRIWIYQIHAQEKE